MLHVICVMVYRMQNFSKNYTKVNFKAQKHNILPNFLVKYKH